MLFGLKNAPEMFPRAINILLTKGKWQYAHIHLDDMFIFLHAQDEHIDHNQQALMSFKSNVIIRRNHDIWFDEMQTLYELYDYSGHIVCLARLEVSTRTIHAIRWLEYTTT